MPPPAIGEKVADFTVAATDDTPFTLSDHAGRHLVIYFYPRDSTPGCTTESKAFAELYGEFSDLNCVLVGVSRDSLKSHEKFKAKYDLPFPLLSDSDEQLCRLFEVIKEKNMYGRKIMGIERSTFLIDASGQLRQQWRKVKVAGHAEEVLAAVREL